MVVRRIKDRVNLAWFALRGRVPYARGYDLYKDRLLAAVLADEAFLDRVRRGEPLPPRYGVGIDERCVEYPWALGHLRGGRGRLLDAGSVLNHDFVIAHPAVAAHEVHVLTLAPEASCFWRRGVSYLFGDLRDNPIRDAYYDAVVSLSTLEHVGCDNTTYSGHAAHQEHRPTDYRLAMRELARVMRPGAALLLSVPYGRHAHHGWLQVFDAEMLADAIAAFGPARACAVTYFRYAADGWSVADADAVADATFTEYMARLDDRPRWVRAEPDRAAAARAVACVRLVKA